MKDSQILGLAVLLIIVASLGVEYLLGLVEKRNHRRKIAEIDREAKLAAARNLASWQAEPEPNSLAEIARIKPARACTANCNKPCTARRPIISGGRAPRGEGFPDGRADLV
jgi:hypothetical protein